MSLHEEVLLFLLPVRAKSMVTLSTIFVLSDYWSSENGQHSYGELRVRGVQIRSVPSNLLCCGKIVVQNVPLTEVNCEKSPHSKG